MVVADGSPIAGRARAGPGRPRGRVRAGSPRLGLHVALRLDERDRRRAVRRSGSRARHGRAPAGASDRRCRDGAARGSGRGRTARRRGRSRWARRQSVTVSQGIRAPPEGPTEGDRWYGCLDVRHPRVVASVALIAVLATVAFPGPAGSRVPSPFDQPDVDLFQQAGDRGCCPRDGDDDRTPRSGGPFRRDPGPRLDAVRASPANGAATGSAGCCPAQGERQVEAPRTRGASTTTCRGTARASTATAPPAARR